jgi:hypothetical protein
MRILKIISKWQHCARCVYYLSEITTHTSNLKNTILVLIDLQSYPPKHPQSSVNDVGGFDYHWLHYVWSLTSHDSSQSHPFCMTLDFQLSFYCPMCYNTRAHCLLLHTSWRTFLFYLFIFFIINQSISLFYLNWQS